MKTLEEIKKILSSYPKMDIIEINKKFVQTLYSVAYTTPERLEEIKTKIGAKRVCITWTPAIISQGIILVFEFDYE